VSTLYVIPSGNINAKYFHRANAFVAFLVKMPKCEILEIGPPKRLMDFFPPARRMRNPDRIRIVSPFLVNLSVNAPLNTFIFAMMRAFLLSIWAGMLSRLFMKGPRFGTLMFYHPQFAFVHLFLPRSRCLLLAYDKADAYGEFSGEPLRMAVRFLDQYATVKADVVLVASDALHVQAKQQRAKRILKVDNGVYTEHFSNIRCERDKSLSVYLGNLNKDIWGADLLLEAVPRIAKDIPDFRLSIVGEGPLRARLQSYCAKLRIAERVKFEGFKPHEEIGTILCKARVGVAPYRRFPGFQFSSSLKILEYLAAGTPVVVTDVGPFAEWIRVGKLGEVVEPTPEGIASGILAVLRLEDAEWEEKSARARKMVQGYDWNLLLSRAFLQIDAMCA